MSKYDWSNKSQFIIDWENSKSICNFLIDKGMTATSGNYVTFKKWYSLHVDGIDTDEHLTSGKVFVENSAFKRRLVNRLIIEEKILPYKCSCGNEGNWNGKRLTLQLEHKNGISNDNRIENLEYLCPNCHSQTTTYMGANIHLKTFKCRIDLLTNHNYKIIDKTKLEKISKLWDIEISSTLQWVRKYKEKMLTLGFSISEDILNAREKKAPKVKKTKSYLSKKDINTIRHNDISSLNIDSENILYTLSQKWNVSEYQVKRWLAVQKIEIKEDIKDVFIIKPIKVVDIQYRLQQLSIITNKKQVPTLAKSWNTSINGAKKWIKNNAPEKFAEIYDDALLEKNKVTALKSQKLDYIKNLTIDNFDLDDFIKAYGKNKSGAYSLLSKYNKDLFAHISKTPDCIHCNGKTRTYGTTIKSGETVQRYRCLDCDKSFSLG